MRPETAIEHLAAGQHGAFSRRQAMDAGMSEREIDSRLESGRYRRLHVGTYAHGGVPDTHELWLMAAVLWGGPTAALSHRGAAGLLGLGPVKSRPEITVVGHFRRPPVTVHRTDYLPAHHVTRRAGIPVTDAARTCFDAGAVLPRHVVEMMVDDAVRTGQASVRQMWARLIEHGGRGRRGCATLRSILEERDPLLDRTKSTFESMMLKSVWKGVLPRPIAQFTIRWRGKVVAVPDFAYPSILLGIEADGYAPHSSRYAFEHDRERDGVLAMLGWEILRFTWTQVRHEPEWVIGCIAEVHARRTALFGSLRHHPLMTE